MITVGINPNKEWAKELIYIKDMNTNMLMIESAIFFSKLILTCCRKGLAYRCTKKKINHM
jgi:hypothetical protein